MSEDHRFCAASRTKTLLLSNSHSTPHTALNKTVLSTHHRQLTSFQCILEAPHPTPHRQRNDRDASQIWPCCPLTRNKITNALPPRLLHRLQKNRKRSPTTSATSRVVSTKHTKHRRSEITPSARLLMLPFPRYFTRAYLKTGISHASSQIALLCTGSMALGTMCNLQSMCANCSQTTALISSYCLIFSGTPDEWMNG